MELLYHQRQNADKGVVLSKNDKLILIGICFFGRPHLLNAARVTASLIAVRPSSL
jgi:hypothetical protein